MLKRFNLIIGLAFIALLLQGCPPSIAYIIYNNTGKRLIIQLKNRKVEWPDRTIITIGDKNNTIATSETFYEDDPNKYLYPNRLVLAGERGLEYEFDFRGKPVPDEYIDRSTGIYTYSWQLESNFILYITLPKSIYPVKMPIRQPTGYPIKPVSVVSGNKN